jgi:hypothetical protein
MEDLSSGVLAVKTSCMKKAFLVAGSMVAMAIAAHAQTKKEPPPPPKPPKPPVEMTKDVPPPPPVPPAPPPPPAPPEFTEDEIADLPTDYQDFLKRNPTIGSVRWNQNSIFIVPKKGKPERFPLTENGLAQAEAKYGKLPASPPPPPEPPRPPVPPKPPVPKED